MVNKTPISTKSQTGHEAEDYPVEGGRHQSPRRRQNLLSIRTDGFLFCEFKKIFPQQTPEEKQHFKLKPANKAILKDTSYYRVFPITENPFNNNDWSYYHNSIGGYNAAKLRIYQDIVENCIFKGADPQVPVNWNILKMLNTKYVISSSQLPQDNLEPFYYDQQNKLLVYKAKYDPQPAWFVGEVAIIEDRDARFAKLNDPDFDTYETAILEEEFTLPIEKPDSSYVKVTPSFNTMKYDIYTDKPALFVASEIYYPAKGGWKAYIDGEEVPIYKTDHILRSIYIEKPGDHEVVFEFSPQTFLKYYKISLIAHIFAFACLIAAAVLAILNRRKEKGRRRTDEEKD